MQKIYINEVFILTAHINEEMSADALDKALKRNNFKFKSGQQRGQWIFDIEVIPITCSVARHLIEIHDTV